MQLESFLLYAPRLYEYYEKMIVALESNDPRPSRVFPESVFAAMTFNLGPQVATFIHTDHLNFAPGWCAIVALGDYDPSKGGHLLLWDLKVAVRFPPGALIFLPSAILRHSNVAVGPSERRYSFTQYTAGGLFRWFECGFQSQKAFEAKGNKHRRTGWERWEEGVQRFSTLEELLARGAETRQA